MLAHLRTVAPRLTTTPWSVLGHSRAVSSSKSGASQQDEAEEVGEENDPPLRSRRETSEGGAIRPRDPPFEQWQNTTGKIYKDPVRPRNWLGGKVPFPMNPSFKPPTPISDRLRTQIYDEYMTNPELYNVRVLSERHGISIQRVDAILRLKGLEDSWKENKQLQTGFQVGMEEILGVADNITTVRGAARGLQELGEDATEADATAARKDRLRDRYQRLFWEPIVEGQEPVVLRELERARMQDQSRARAEAERKDAQARVPPPKEEVHAVVRRPGRSTIKFVDVGGKFVDLDDRLARLKAAKHRSQVRAKRRGGVRATEDVVKSRAIYTAH